MKLKYLISTLTILSIFTFTSCDEGGTIDVPGPAINYSFNYESSYLESQVPLNAIPDSWIVIGEDSVKGADLQSFLSDSANQKFSDMVQAAKIKDAQFVVTGGDFTGLDSIKISYQIIGANQVLDLVVGAPTSVSSDTIKFDNLKVTKEQAFELIGNDAVIKLSAIFNPETQNFLKEGAIYQFKAKTTLSVKVIAAAENLLGTAK